MYISWVGRLNNVTKSTHPKLIYTVNTVTIKIPAGFVLEIDKLIKKLIW